MLKRNKGYSFLNIFGLAVGLACAGLIFLWVEDELSFDSNNLKKDNVYLVRVNEGQDAGMVTHSSTPGPLAQVMQTTMSGVVNTCRSTDNTSQQFRIGEKVMNAYGRYTDPSVFQLFTLPFIEGNSKTAFTQIASIVLTEKAARKFFNDDKNIVGRTVEMNNQQLVVTGVIRALPENSTLQVEWLAPFPLFAQKAPKIKNWGNFCLNTYVEMRPGTDIAAFNKPLLEPLYDFTTQKKEADISSDHIFLFGMKDWRLHDQFENGKPTGGGRIQYIRLFSTIAWIVLFIACVNFMNLATARSEKRSREVGVRKVLGAGKSSLIRQFIGEAVFMAALATITSVMLMSLVLPAFNGLVGKDLHLELFKPLHFTALVLLTLICGIVSGSYPSLYLSSFNPVFVLKGIKAKTSSAAFIRKGLVVLQFTVSIVLIIGTMVIYLQVQHIKNRSLGFNKDKLVQMDLQGDMLQKFPAIKQELLNTGDISNVALADHPTLYGGNNTSAIGWPGKPAESKVIISQRVVSPEYISTLGMKLVEGRDFVSTDSFDPAKVGKDSTQIFHVLITTTMERLLGKGSAVGRTMDYHTNFGRLQLLVEGVVEDYVYGDMYGQPAPVVFYCMPIGTNRMYIRMKPQADPEQALAKMEKALKKTNPGYPFEYTFVEDQFNALFLSETLISKLSRVFAFLAIFISCVGLFGLAAYTAESRIKEIGIRKVLGASASGITVMLSKDFLKLTIVSCLAAFPLAAWIMYKWLQSYTYRIGLAWWVFALAGGLALLISLVTVSSQALRAALANPVKSMRAD